MNPILLFSSILTFFITIIMLVYFYDDKDLYFIIGTIMILGTILGIFNHGTSSKFYKYIDRVFITITVLFYCNIIDTYYEPYYYIYIIMPILCYLISKSMNNYIIRSLWHFVAHMLISYSHFIVL